MTVLGENIMKIRFCFQQANVYRKRTIANGRV